MHLSLITDFRNDLLNLNRIHCGYRDIAYLSKYLEMFTTSNFPDTQKNGIQTK